MLQVTKSKLQIGDLLDELNERAWGYASSSLTHEESQNQALSNFAAQIEASKRTFHCVSKKDFDAASPIYFTEGPGRKPIAGKDYDPDAPMSQDEHEYLTGTGQY